MQKSIVLHADILGFKNIVKSSENDTNNETLNKLKSVLERSVQTLKGFNNKPNTKNIKINYKLFSDNLYVSFSYEENNILSFSEAFLSSVFFSRIYFSVMLDNEFLIRGGISFGTDYSDDNMIFSFALVKAYELESEKAIYPRIVIDSELVILAKKGLDFYSNTQFNALNNSILIDLENLYFINTSGLAKDINFKLNNKSVGQDMDKVLLSQNIQFLKNSLVELKKDEKENEKIIIKYNWLIEILIWNFFDRKKQPFKYGILLFEKS